MNSVIIAWIKEKGLILLMILSLSFHIKTFCPRVSTEQDRISESVVFDLVPESNSGCDSNDILDKTWMIHVVQK